MRDMIARMEWKESLRYSGKRDRLRLPHKHERIKYRVLSRLEKMFFGGRQIGGFENYKLLNV